MYVCCKKADSPQCKKLHLTWSHEILLLFKYAKLLSFLFHIVVMQTLFQYLLHVYIHKMEHVKSNWLEWPQKVIGRREFSSLNLQKVFLKGKSVKALNFNSVSWGVFSLHLIHATISPGLNVGYPHCYNHWIEPSGLEQKNKHCFHYLVKTQELVKTMLALLDEESLIWWSLTLVLMY